MKTIGMCALGVMTLTALGACGGATSPDAVEGADDISADIDTILGGVKTTAYPGAALLSMTSASGAGYACTATVIAPKVVLTAGHCVDGMTSFQVIAGGSMRTSKKAETFDWKENGAQNVNPNHHDIGLIYLTDPIVLAAYPTLADAKSKDGAAAVDVGRIKGGVVTSDIFSAPITVSDGASIGYPFDYRAAGVIEHGDSGGPVFATGTQQIIAVNSGAGGGIEVLARVDLLRPWIVARLSGGADAGAAPADAGAKSDGGAKSDASAPPPPPPTPPAPAPPPPAACAGNEAEPNDDVTHASVLKTNMCGKTATATDVDWYSFVATTGRTTLTLAPDGTGDAVASFGFVSAGKCVVAATNARVVAVAVTGATASVCISVSSPAKKVQTYRLTAAR